MHKKDGTPCCEAFEKELKHGHCCELMTEMTHDSRIPLEYSAEQRSYYIPKEQYNSAVDISYCPWCGTELPETLQKITLNKEYIREAAAEDDCLILKDDKKPINGALCLTWNHLHNDWEAYADRAGFQHLGTLDPSSKTLYKRPIKGRKG